jgi:hypothetical protein
MDIYSNAKEMSDAALEASPANNFSGTVNSFNKQNATIETELFHTKELNLKRILFVLI